MKNRMHLFEFEDLKYFPKFLRGYITDLLTHQIVKFGIYKVAVPKIVEALQSSNQDSIVDLCSGSGGPSIGVAKATSEFLGRHIKLYLTDKYPNVEAFLSAKSHSVEPIMESVDARAVPSNLQLNGMRTLFTSFHHFKPNDGQEILKDAFKKGNPIGIFEITERKFGSFLTLLVAPITCLLFTPFVKPRKLGRFFWTYIVPVVPFLYTWDGLVSNLRSYTKDEWMQMTKKLADDSYSWETGEFISRFHIKVSYLIGSKRKVSVF